MAAVRAGAASIVLQLGRGVWIRPGTVHEVSCRGPAAYNAFYVTSTAQPFPTELKVLNVSPFPHALVEEFLTFETAYDEAGSKLPRDPRLLRVCEGLRLDLADNGDIDAWAAVAGMSRRTFTRAFRQETSVDFSHNDRGFGTPGVRSIDPRSSPMPWVLPASAPLPRASPRLSACRRDATYQPSLEDSPHSAFP
jgi:hypothetical protein